MEVFVSNQQLFLEISVDSVKSVVEEVLSIENKKYDEVSIFFITKDGICSLHAQYFNDPTPTDCISFPIDDETEEGYKVLGDVFICPETAKDFLSQTNPMPSQEEIYKETTLYLVHGLLHLLGYDDIDENDRQKMRHAEKKCLEALISKQILIQ